MPLGKKSLLEERKEKRHPFRNVNLMTLNNWIYKTGSYIEFFRVFGLRHEWSVPKWLEIHQNNLHIKFSALILKFSRPVHAAVKKGYPLKVVIFCHWLI